MVRLVAHPSGTLKPIKTMRQQIGEPRRTANAWIAVSTVLLVGCGSTQAQLHALQIAGTAKTTLARYKSCLAPIEAKPEYGVIYEMIAVERTRDPPGMMPSDAPVKRPD
jgi:hypothetical protein